VFTVSATPVGAGDIELGQLRGGRRFTRRIRRAVRNRHRSGGARGNVGDWRLRDAILQSVSVAIDGQNAAMIYVSPNQITVQVPYTVTIGPGKVVVVNNNGVITTTTVTTVATAPGLFT